MSSASRVTSVAPYGPFPPYLPAVDGLRGLAVLAVIAYHANVGWSGGFLGVEIFLVISGYLITSLLLAEKLRTGVIDLPRFWLRRARRLLPGLYWLLLVWLSLTAFFWPAELARLRDDSLAAIAYVSNWYLVLRQTSYFEAVGRPPLLQHLWSLAIEEQFYVIWPPLLGLLLMLAGRRMTLLLTFLAALAASVAMGLLFQPGFDPSRVYYGTDTRATGLLLGAALALARPAWNPVEPRWRRARDLVGGVALVGLGVLTLMVQPDQPLLYQGGFLWVGLLTVVVIVAAADREGLLARWLGGKWLRWVGLRSYSLYLWHWPIVCVTRPDLDVDLHGVPLLVLRLFLTVVCAECSYRLVELPLRQGWLGRRWHALRVALHQRDWPTIIRWSSISLALVMYVMVLGWLAAQALTPAVPVYLGGGS